MPAKEGTKLKILRPDDWHLHLRDGSMLQTVLPHTAKCFGRAIIMPNLVPPITTVKKAQDYRQRISNALPKNFSFDPLMTLFLCEETTKEEVQKAKSSDFISGVKLYPADSTTHSSQGVQNIEKFYPLFGEMEKIALPLLIHAEAVNPDIDVFDREKVFIERFFQNITKEFPQLKVVLEHASTKEAVDFVQDSSPLVGATITAHHLLWNRNAIFDKGLRPNRYCLPLLKTEKDRLALIRAALSKSKKFFLGTDSAPHKQSQKEKDCGCAGIYSAPCALELYTEIFDKADALDCLEDFASRNGALFYEKKINTDTITLIKKKRSIPQCYPVGKENLVPIRAGETVEWSIFSDSFSE